MITNLLLLLALFFMLYYLFKVKKEDGYVYGRFPIAHKNLGGSLANPKNVRRGYRWTNYATLKNKFKKSKKNRAYIDNFRFDDEFIRRCKMPRSVVKRAEKTEIYFDPIKMREGVLVIGKMGSGKTEFYFNILSQDFYTRAIIHQTKVGDFVSKFLKRGDILFSPYDARGWLWDVMSESEGLLKTFFEIYSNAIQGDKKDFFAAASERLYNEMAQKIKTQYSNATSAEKWLLLIKVVKDLFAEMETGTQNSKKDIKGTMEAIIEPLEIMAWKMQNPKQKSFTIKDFFKKKNQAKLILDNIPEHEKSLTPLFAAFTACVSQVHTSMRDTKTDFTLYALDEYLSFISVLDESSRKRLHTLIRSKGGILMPGVQYIPKDDKKLQQALTSSAYAWIVFSVIDDETITLFKKTIGEVEYSYEDINTNNNGNKKNKSYSTKRAKDFLIYPELINGLADKYEHITYLPNHKYIYKGYTPQVELKDRAKRAVEIDLSEFYKIKYNNDNQPKVDLKYLTFKDLFKDKPLSKLEEFKLWKKFQAVRDKEEKLKEFKNTHKLTQVNLEFLFEKYLPDKAIIENKMKMYSFKERFELFKKWIRIRGNDEKELEFIEQYDLFGALPDFFKFEQEDGAEI